MTEGCPEGWEFVRLGQITSKVGSGSTPRGGSESYQRAGIPLIRSMNVRFEGFTKEGLAFLNQKQADALKEVTVRPDDVLLNITGASIGRVTQAPAFMDGARVNQHVCIIRVFHEIDAAYLSRYLASPSVQQMIWGEQYGVTRQALTKSQILDFQIPLAPSREQRRIVERIDALFEQVISAREHLSRVPLILKRFRQAVLAAACSGRLTEDWREKNPQIEPATLTLERIRHQRFNGKQLDTIAPVDSDELPELPDSWVWARFGVLLGELRNGISTKPELSPPGVSILRISSVRSGCVSLIGHRFLPNGADLLPEYGLRDGDLLFTRYNGSIDLLGVCGMVRGLGRASALYPDKLMRVRFDHEHVLPAYAELFFQSVDARDRLTAQSRSSAGQQGVSGADIKSQPFALAPFGEQVEIIDRVSPLLAMADRIEERLGKALKYADKLTQPILAKAFRGELVSTEAELARREGREYEPASVLLERIKKERESQTSTKPESKRTRLKAKLATTKG
jgi:type I restriction enzyme, S subunit